MHFWDGTGSALPALRSVEQLAGGEKRRPNAVRDDLTSMDAGPSSLSVVGPQVGPAFSAHAVIAAVATFRYGLEHVAV
jgi:hypothetical protein